MYLVWQSDSYFPSLPEIHIIWLAGWLFFSQKVVDNSQNGLFQMLGINWEYVYLKAILNIKKVEINTYSTEKLSH